ncbi:alpha/beta hydrolase [Actinoplanes sp. NPDC049802]|uniref:alpha/beta fold hydrolase n=1 Tax=Actinoplanes sp. NPDC049802 TaxID=3154742 RepID=UPI0033FD8A58
MPFFPASDGVGLFYDVLGAGDPLVVLGGGPGMDVRYLGDLGGLAADRRLIRLDGRGAGRSGVPADRSTVSFVRQAADVEALRGHLGLDRLDVLAHSAGSLTAQEFAARHPDRVRRLILVTPVGRHGRDIDPTDLAAVRATRHAEPWYPRAAAAARELAAGGRGPFLQARLIPFHWHRWTPERRHEYVPGHSTTPPWFRDAFYAGAEAACPAPVTAPVLVVAGASDGMIGVAPSRTVAAAHPHARLEMMAASGHRPWVEEPDAFRGLVNAFLR